ncbi:hypothetical protein GQ53DRAFT_743848 [Thozetella sp. PMI_491]|nr:hypothetical protein GQ53DRAFT_743848 [Thozetella sp. PMI_491]
MGKVSSLCLWSQRSLRASLLPLVRFSRTPRAGLETKTPSKTRLEPTEDNGRGEFFLWFPDFHLRSTSTTTMLASPRAISGRIPATCGREMLISGRSKIERGLCSDGICYLPFAVGFAASSFPVLCTHRGAPAVGSEEASPAFQHCGSNLIFMRRA